LAEETKGKGEKKRTGEKDQPLIARGAWQCNETERKKVPATRDVETHKSE